MSIKLKDIKLLWGRAANRCSLCPQELSHGPTGGATYPLGEQAHIVAREADGPRGNSPLSPEERDSYANLILLCPTCHVKIDKDVLGFPIERLYLLKTNHELRVREVLSADAIEDPALLLYSDIIDSIVDCLNLKQWDWWASSATAPTPAWPVNIANAIFPLQQRLQKMLWPGKHEELELTIWTLVIAVAECWNLFRRHSVLSGDIYLADRFYRGPHQDPETYARAVERFEDWLEACDELLREATRAANWFADVVRREVNPMFFLLHGKFVLVEGMFEDLSHRSYLYEYDADSLPESVDGFRQRVALITEKVA